MLASYLDDFDAQVIVSRVEVQDGKEVAYAPADRLQDLRHKLHRFDLATVTAEGSDAEEALETTVEFLESNPRHWCPYRRYRWIRDWLDNADPSLPAGILQAGAMTQEERHRLSHFIWRGRSLYRHLRDCYLGQSRNYEAPVTVTLGAGPTYRDVADTLDASRDQETVPVTEEGEEALAGLLEWMETEVEPLREWISHLDQVGRASYDDENRKEVARRVLRFREVTGDVLHHLDLKPAERFLGKKARTYALLGWI